MVSLPLLRFLLSIDFNSYVGTCLGTESTSDAAFRLFHMNNIVAASVILGRIGQHIFWTTSETKPAALTPFPVNYYGSFWHMRALT